MKNRIHRNNLGAKLFLILGLGILFLIPMGLLRSVVRDRLRYRESAIDSVLGPIGNNFALLGVTVAVPYTERTDENEKNAIRHLTAVIYPDEYNVAADLEVSNLKRGIFDVPIFNAALSISGQFEKAVDEIPKTATETVFLVFDVADSKNLLCEPKVTVSDQTPLSRKERVILPPTDSQHLYKTTFLYPIPLSLLQSGFSFQMKAEGRGGKSFTMRAVQGENSFSVKSNWPDPGFFGEWLPSERTVTDEGFSALWEIAGFNVSDAGNNSYSIYNDSVPQHVQVSFLQINDIYKQVERSMKYAILFIFIPFLALFFAEAVKKSPIHPAQYLLVGMANVLFYLLLLSLAEYIPFNAAYIAAMIMTVALGGLYSAAIFKSKKTGGLLGSISLLAYLFLFGLLQLVDYALLVGTLGMFAALALIMFVTRNLNWYDLLDSAKQAVISNEMKTTPADDPKTKIRDDKLDN